MSRLLMACVLLGAGGAMAGTAPPPRFSIKSADKFGAMDIAGKEIIAPRYDDELHFADGVARVRMGLKYGFIDSDGQVVISPKLTITSGEDDFAEERSLAALIEGDFAEGLAVYSVGDRKGYVDHAGKVIIPAQYLEAEAFRDSAALVRTASGYGLIEPSGKFLIEPRIERAFWFAEGLAAVNESGKGFGYIDQSGAFVIAPQYNYAFNFSGGLARVQFKGRGYGYIDQRGAVAIEPPEGYKLSADFVSGVAPVNVPGKGWGLIDSTGKFVVEPQFFSLGKFSAGLAPVAVGTFEKHAWGYIDAGGKLVGAAQYDRAEPFSGGLGQVRLREGGVGFVDAGGKLVIGPLRDYTQVDAFRDGLAKVWFSQIANEQGVWGYIDSQGKLIWRGQ